MTPVVRESGAVSDRPAVAMSSGVGRSLCAHDLQSRAASGGADGRHARRLPDENRNPHPPSAGATLMRTLHFGLRVADLDRSIAFDTAVGYQIVGSVADIEIGDLTMLKLPGDEFVTIELVHDPSAHHGDGGTALSHVVIEVDSMKLAVAELSARGVDADVPTSPDGSPDFQTSSIVDPTATGSSSSNGQPVTPTG